MEIIENFSTILYYSVNPDYFRKNRGVATTRSIGSNLTSSKEMSYVFTLNFRFEAKSENSQDYFIQYASRLIVRFRKNNFETDFHDMSKIIDDFFLSVRSFIENNSMSYFKYLNVNEFIVPDSLNKRVEALFSNFDELKPYESKSIMEKELDEEISKKLPQMSFASEIKFAEL